ncbi:ATP-binding protein [Anaerolineae bacterium CFX9]|jgi:DNA helicase HerA-like ATPase|nr:ATP-binding protein [Anaerolineae bacterium CFX9]
MTLPRKPGDGTYDLDHIFGNSVVVAPERLGVVVGGSLSKGLTIKLDADQPIEDLAVGRYVVVEGDRKRFFCMITDVALDNTNPEIQSNPPDISDPFLRAVYTGTTAYGKVHMQPMLTIENDDLAQPKPVKTIPGHFMTVRNATVEDVNAVFGSEDADHFYIGEPLELETTQINLRLSRMVERSVGVFGKSGTGKSFLTRLLLAGVIVRDKASALIFDMHNDYGRAVKDESGTRARGLKDLLNDKIRIVSLDPESSRKRGSPPDLEMRLSFQDIEPEDLEMLRETMNLSDAMIDAAHTLRKRWGRRWVETLINAGADEFDEIEANTPTRAGTLAALQRRLQRFERWSFLTPDESTDIVDQIMHMLDKYSVVLEFGRFGNSLEAYILVANYLTRRIHEKYVDKMERALGEKINEPRQLMIVIEEAHKFLDPRIASQTIFGTIAREMRKYNVTLLIVDQRPSAIDEEVMSQIGTRVTALLDNEKDINAVLTGISGAASLREVLARLDTRQQAIIIGHAVPMPVVVKTRTYDEEFYQAIMNDSYSGKPVMNEPRSRIGRNGESRRIR